VTLPGLPWNCGACRKPVVLTGRARKHAVERGRGYCSRACSDAGRAANVSVAMTAMWNDPAARARMMAARRRARQGRH
jgi:hypothetical protein